MANSTGGFVWYELMTTDKAAAAAFYGGVVGWGTEEANTPGVDYTLLTAGGTQVGGILPMPEAPRAAGVNPAWMVYVGVDDVDAKTAQAETLGASVHVRPTDIPTIGRFSVIQDPQGAPLYLFKGQGSSAPAADPHAPGHIGWHELATTDWSEAFSFYSAMFGWQKGDPVDMGPMGTYQLFGFGGPPFGGMFTKAPAMPGPFWLTYIRVPDIGSAVTRIEAGGGKILNGPMEVPGNDWIVQASDPQGAMFALVSSKA